MNLKQLEYFVTSAEVKNISIAGKKLHMSQPPLSRQIQLLEEDLGVKLIIRGNKGIELTENGQVFYAMAKKLLQDIDEMREVLTEMELGMRGKIRIGLCYSAFPIVMEKVRAFLKENRQVTFSFVHDHIDELYKGLYTGQIDLLFLRNCVLNNDDFCFQPLSEDTLQLVIHKDIDPCPDCDEVDIGYLKEVPLCVLNESKSPGQNDVLINGCLSHGFLPNIICDCYDTSVGMALALSKVGATYQPSSVIANYFNPDLRIKHIRELEIKSYSVMVWHKNYYFSRCAKNFLSMFINNKDT